MIPHHQNAVNMAKVLLHQQTLNCSDVTNEDDADCIMEVRTCAQSPVVTVAQFYSNDFSCCMLCTINFFSLRLLRIYKAILRDIVVTQNFQIQGMRKVLEMNDFASTADCIVDIMRSTEVTDNITAPTPAKKTSGSAIAPLSTSYIGWMILFLIYVL
jgi:hypothetical protein